MYVWMDICTCVVKAGRYFQGRNVAVFFGSQTGTAEDLANRLSKDATRYGMKAVALDPEECDMVGLALDYQHAW